jgi:hypothetical protein
MQVITVVSNYSIRIILFDRVLSSVHIATNILINFDLLDENDHAQDYDVFLFLAQSQFDLIVTQFMVITAVDGYDHYVILSD